VFLVQRKGEKVRGVVSSVFVFLFSVLKDLQAGDMPLKKWRSMDIFNFSPRENPIMESISNKFAEISQSHAGTLLRNRR
jgi:hypothetical protein